MNDPEKKMLVALVGRWAWQDAPALRSWLTDHATTLDVAVVQKLGDAVKKLAGQDPAATRAWAEALPNGPLREQVGFQIALSACAEGDFRQAAAAYEAVAATDPTGALAGQLAAALAGQDGAAAAEWAMQRSEGPARTAAVSAVAEQWSQRDPRGAAAWIEQMPPGAEHDAAVHEFVAKVVYADPPTAAEWVKQVTDPAKRAKAAEEVFFIWNSENPIASREWLRDLPGVEESWRAEFLRTRK